MGSKSNLAFVRDNLTSSHDLQYQFAVNYVYDYLKGSQAYLHPPHLKLNDHIRRGTFLALAASKSEAVVPKDKVAKRGPHAIDISPFDAGLPWPSGIAPCRQSKHWQISVETARDFLNVCAQDTTTAELVARSKAGVSIADMARHELTPDLAEGWAKFPVYLFPEGDEHRTRLLSAMNVYITLFDEIWESQDTEVFSCFQKAFVARLRTDWIDTGAVKSPLQALVDDTMTEILEVDRATGNTAGRELIELMVRFLSRPPPPEKYHSLREFLSYRHEDAALPFVLGCTKFSFDTKVDIDSPRLANYIRLLKDQVCIANDIASWAKEKRAYDAGKILHLINTVGVIMNIFDVSADAAITMAAAMQFQTECEIDEEVSKLIDEDALTADEWLFLDASVYVMTGNVLVPTVALRYGGEACKLW